MTWQDIGADDVGKGGTGPILCFSQDFGALERHRVGRIRGWAEKFPGES
jgi:hypothetical protein